jgi:16S rRNA (guanine527-N7)-methyltransferase
LSESAQADADEALALCAGLGLTPTAAQLHALMSYLDLLARWNSTYNLTAVRDRAGMLSQHLADCLAVVTPLQRQLPTGTSRVLDVGSGGGLPGVVLAALLPEVSVTCLDAVGKKMAFVRQVAGELRLPNLHAAHSRIEAFKAPLFDVVASRAFSSLVDFTSLSRPQLAPGGVWMAMKGRVPNEEIAALPASVSVFHVEQLAVPGLDAQRCLIWMRPG